MAVRYISEIYTSSNWAQTHSRFEAYLGLYPSSEFISVSHDTIFSTSHAHDLRWRHTDLKSFQVLLNNLFGQTKSKKQLHFCPCLLLDLTQAVNKPANRYWSAEAFLSQRLLPAYSFALESITQPCHKCCAGVICCSLTLSLTSHKENHSPEEKKERNKKENLKSRLC